MYATLTGATVILLFGVIFWSTSRFMRHQIDDSIANELNEVLTDPQSKTPGGMQLLVDGMAHHSAGFHYLMQDPNRVVLAGNLPSIDPQIGVREWSGRARQGWNPYAGIRGQGVQMNGNYVFVGWSTYQLREMEEFVIGAFLWGLAASMILALAGGIVMSRRLMRKIETVSETSRDIIEGDLKRRVPVEHGGDEFDHLAFSINAMLDRIETLMEDLRQVTTDIAHDLRTPLTRLRNRLELALRPATEKHTLRDIVAAARCETDTILDIFGALLRIAQIESGVRKAAFAWVGMGDVIDTAVEIYRSSADEKSQRLVSEVLPRPGLHVRGDRELLTQLFTNLIENAIQHSPPGATIRVSAQQRRGHIHVEVADDGPGIPDEFKDKVMQRFYRMESSRTTPGSGLGLSLATAIARLHDAVMTLADNSPGLRVIVSLPSAEDRSPPKF